MTPYKLKILNGVLKLKSFADVVLNIFGIKDLGTQTGNVIDGLVDWSIQHLTKTTAQWNGDSTTILLKGQLGIEDTSTTTFKLKVGDGISTWQQLGYIAGGGGTDFPEHLYLTVVNKTGDNLLASDYKVVKVSSAQGQRLAIDYAQANNDANSADTIGIVYENINNNQTGKIVTIGELTGLNTTGTLQGETWTDGDVLYLSPFNEGQITNIKPNAPNHLVTLGYVVYSHQNNGKIYVKCDNGYEIGELHDVYAPSPNNNEGLFWSSGTNRYENKSVLSVLGYTPENIANKGVSNGYAPLSSDAKIDAAYLPAYVDEVLEYANLAAFPVTGASDKIYIALDTNKVYRWSGSVYIEVAANSGVWGAITGTLSNQTDLQNALDAKQNLLAFTPYIVRCMQMNSFNPADSTTYYLGNYSNNPATNIQQRKHIYNNNYNIKIVNLFVLQSISASNETITISLYNITTNTNYSIGTFTSDYGTGISKIFKFNTNISVNNTDEYTYRIITPIWSTNPTNWTLSIEEYLA